MRRELSTAQRALVVEVDEVLRGRVEAPDRECFRALGAANLLAVHYPPEYGGRGLTPADHAAVSERIGLHGLPDVPHLVSVQGVGCPILTLGDAGQRERWLPGIASGEVFASLLLSEVGAGSDLTGISTRAVADGVGWRVTGQKAWSMWTGWSDVALCSVRTRVGDHRYDGISLFLVDLRAPGVTVEPAPRAAGEPYCTVTFDDVSVGADARLGPLHRGWAALPSSIGFERGGFDYLTRAQAWLAASAEVLGALAGDHQADLAAGFARNEFLVHSARALAFHAAATADGLAPDDTATAYVKLATGVAAQAVARWAGAELLPQAGAAADERLRRLLHAAVLEAPELTVSGGPQEQQLDLICRDPMIGGANP